MSGILKYNDALLEIGAEEIPAGYIEPVLKQIKELAQKKLSGAGLAFGEIKTYATPRRLVLYVSALADKSKDTSEELLGPSLQAAKDANGNWTQAAIGFASKNGVKPEKLSVKNTDKGERLFFVKSTKGEKTEKLLTVIFPDIIKSIYFPKTMVWEQSGFKFARPVRSVVALYGKKVIKFTIADVKSGKETIGLHTIDNRKIKIDEPKNYFIKLKNKSVIVNQDERREAIAKSIEQTVKSAGSVIKDESLIDEVDYLVEYPTAVLCEFDKKYLALPAEALTVCIKKSQKCFAVNDKKGNFSNYFLDIKNGISKYQEIAREGYEKVVGARLSDAEFFYNNDLKKGLEANYEKLQGVIFHKEIGTIYEKVERVRALAGFINKSLGGVSADASQLDRAVVLSKTDLLSEMVFEYGELQGIMGRIYAQKLGESQSVADAIEQHYWPLSAGGKLPENKYAVIISIADKIDTLAANFAIGLEPSGSADPYGLRRAAIGLIRIIEQSFANADFNAVLYKSFELLPEKVKNNPKYAQGKDKLLAFLWARIENMLESDGYTIDDIRAVVNASKKAGFSNIGDIRLKLDALKSAKTKGDFTSVSLVFKRINNIIEKQGIDAAVDVNTDLLAEPAEKALYEAAQKAFGEVSSLLSLKRYAEVFEQVLVLKPVIDEFFEKVMVNDKNEEIKKNRYGLLKYIKNIFEFFIDFSALQ